MDAVARRYAEALFLAAREASAVDPVAGDLEQIHELVSDAALSAAMEDASVPQSARLVAIEKIAEGRHTLTANFLKLLVAKGRTGVLASIWPAYRAQLLADKNETDGIAESATPLDEQEIERLTAVATKLTGKKVHLQTRVDETLLAGVRLRVGNTLYDASASSSLERMEKALMAAPLHS